MLQYLPICLVSKKFYYFTFSSCKNFCCISSLIFISFASNLLLISSTVSVTLAVICSLSAWAVWSFSLSTMSTVCKPSSRFLVCSLRLVYNSFILEKKCHHQVNKFAERNEQFEPFQITLFLDHGKILHGNLSPISFYSSKACKYMEILLNSLVIQTSYRSY